MVRSFVTLPAIIISHSLRWPLKTKKAKIVLLRLKGFTTLLNRRAKRETVRFHNKIHYCLTVRNNEHTMCALRALKTISSTQHSAGLLNCIICCVHICSFFLYVVASRLTECCLEAVVEANIKHQIAFSNLFPGDHKNTSPSIFVFLFSCCCC